MGFNRNIKYIFVFLFFCITLNLNAQNDAYYSSINPSLTSFISDLKARIRLNYVSVSYNRFNENVENFASYSNGDGTRTVICVYSGFPRVYTPPFSWYTNPSNFTYNFSREHTWCRSWMPEGAGTEQNQDADQHHIFPVQHNDANNVRSNNPLGNVVGGTISYYYGAKIGLNAVSGGYTVYEPRDQHKGDAARALLYMCIRWDGVNGKIWDFNSLNTLLGSTPQNLNVLLQWHRQDPPDKWEVKRNDYIETYVQHNRNPLVDHPEYADYINFNTMDKVSSDPVYAVEPTNHATGLSGTALNNTITINWTPAIAGSQAPSGYLIEVFDEDSYYIPIDGYSLSETNLDSFKVKYVTAATTSFPFPGLTTGKTYYFSVYPYNGDGTLRNYKTTGSVPRTNVLNGTVSLATVPSNHVTAIGVNNVTSSTINLTWTDALPGSQAPSGYLIQANNNNIFTTPVNGTVYADDANLADGSAVVNVGTGVGQYLFSSLSPSTAYYFKVYSYNGTGSSRNYKTDGTIPNVSQTTSASSGVPISVFTDNFNTNSSIAWTTSGAIGSSSFSVSRSGDDWGARRNTSPLQLELTNDASATANANGWVFASTGTGSFSSPYNTTLSSNIGIVTWSFNMRQIRTDPAGFASGNYGVAFILAGSSTSAQTSGSGYAVVLGQSGTTDPVRLAKYASGLQGSLTDIIISNTTGLTDFGAEYLSVKVTYNPANNTWELFLRNDVASFTDPASGTLTSQGTATDNSYTGSSLGYSGGYWQGSTAGTQTAFFDNYSVSVNATNPINPLAFSASTGSSTQINLSAQSNANGNNIVVVYNGEETFTTPTDGVALGNAGDAFAGGTILYKGNAASLINHASLTAGQTVYYMAFSYNAANYYSTGLTANATTYKSAPVTQANNISFSSVSATGMTVNWFNGNGDYRVVYINNTNSFTPPTDGTSPSANTVYAGSGQQCIYNSNGLGVAITGLSAETDYWIRVYEYNNTSANTLFNSSTGTNNPSSVFYENSNTIASGTYNNLVLNSGVATNLTGSVIVNSTLTLTNGNLILGSNNLTLGSGGTISGANASNYIVTNGSGVVTINSIGSSDVTFPIGTATSYNPVTIRNTTAINNVSAKVYTSFTGTPPDPTKIVPREWDITPTGIGNTLILKLQFNSSDFTGTSFNPDGSIVIGHYVGSLWTELSGTISGINPYVVTSGEISSFSPFVIGNQGALPVTLSSFVSNIQSRNVKLNWVTESEINNAGFDVERGNRVEGIGNSWQKVAFVAGHGTKNTPTNYSFEDKNLNTGKYKYRLKQIDHNGNFEYFELSGEVEVGVPKKYDLSRNYPNPFNPVTKINFDLPVDSRVSILIYDVTGREVARVLNNEFKKAGYYTTEFKAGNLSSGVYFYVLNTDNFRAAKKMVVLK